MVGEQIPFHTFSFYFSYFSTAEKRKCDLLGHDGDFFGKSLWSHENLNTNSV